MARKAAPNHYKGYSIRKRGNTFQIRVSHEGKQESFTFKAPENLSESKQYAAAEKEAIRLRDLTKSGYTTTMPTLQAYSDYVMHTKKELNIKRATLKQYSYLMPRILEEFGEDLLDQITPQRLNKFYIKLANSYTLAPASAVAKDDSLKKLIKERDLTFTYIHEMAHVGKNTISMAVRGTKVALTTAEKICAFLGVEVKDYFYVISNAELLSNKTVREHITLLSTILKMAVRERIIDFNPVDASNVPKKQKTTVNYYQPEEVVEIWKRIDEQQLRWRVLVTLLIVTGCRRGEICGIKWSSVIWEHNLLHINHEVLFDDEGIYTEDSLKNDDDKYVQFDPETKLLLQEYRATFENDMKTLNIPKSQWPEYIFYQVSNISKPIHPSSVNAFLTRFSNKYGFRKINPHALRHSLASALIADGVDDVTLSKQLGHKQVSTTREIYGHQIKEHQAKVAARIPQIYNRDNSLD
ncbi:MAG: tyrosine-type recombinase/integrase [Agathobacter sp.]|nr:tyrosine-type recombinase/integrase [Agathobacter sp.]